MSDEQRDVIEILVHDHREVEDMFQELEGLQGQSGEDVEQRRRDLVDQVTIELVRHSVAEEVLVYPRVGSKISQDQVDHAREEHKEAERTMANLEKLDPTDAAFD